MQAGICSTKLSQLAENRGNSPPITCPLEGHQKSTQNAQLDIYYRERYPIYDRDKKFRAFLTQQRNSRLEKDE